jgi:hypothetical protein
MAELDQPTAQHPVHVLGADHLLLSMRACATSEAVDSSG